MRIIVHLDDPTDMILAMRSLKASIAGGYASCGYRYEDDTSTFVERNKTGWTVRVFTPPADRSE